MEKTTYEGIDCHHRGLFKSRLDIERFVANELCYSHLKKVNNTPLIVRCKKEITRKWFLKRQ